MATDHAKVEAYIKDVTKIQAAGRGHITRQKNKKEIEEIKSKAKVLESYRSDKYMIDMF
jgi:hypothetical protein